MMAAMDTRGDDYASRLITKPQAWWKRALRVQALYQWHLRRHRLGRTLDIGCGVGRNLVSLEPGSVGVDHNEAAVRHARGLGLTALTSEEFLTSTHATPASYDSLLVAHVVEHMTPLEAQELVRSYVPFLRPGGSVLFICPQERGYRSDPTHVTWTTAADLTRLARECGLVPVRARSFPLARPVGKIFTYNEFVVRARLPLDPDLGGSS
jgi:SAM-dependent methyltransferase